MCPLQTLHVTHPSVTPKRDLFTRWPSPFFHLQFCSLVDNFCTSDKLRLLRALAPLLSIPCLPLANTASCSVPSDSCSCPTSRCYFYVRCPYCCSQSHSPRQLSPCFPLGWFWEKWTQHMLSQTFAFWSVLLNHERDCWWLCIGDLERKARLIHVTSGGMPWDGQGSHWNASPPLAIHLQPLKGCVYYHLLQLITTAAEHRVSGRRRVSFNRCHAHFKEQNILLPNSIQL